MNICKEGRPAVAVMLVDGEMPGGGRFRIQRMTDDPFDDAVGALSRAAGACELDGLVRALRHLATSLAGHRHATVLQPALQ